MTTVKAAQIVYTRVEREQSPRGVAGFQTLFCTRHALLAEVVEEAELYFGFDSASATEGGLVFGPVGKKQLLLARRTCVSDLDRCGRGGNYIAHAVVFSEDDFLALGGNPIVIAGQISFITQLAEALSSGDTTSGNISPMEVSCVKQGKDLDELTEGWSTDNLANLLILASCAERQPGRDAPIALAGSAQHVANVLELVFSVMPHALRCRLSFDLAAPSSKQSLPFWACIFTKEPRRLSDTIDAGQKTADAIDGDSSLSSFGNWIGAQVRENQTTNLASSGEAAWALCQLIDHGDSTERTPIGHVNTHVARQVWSANPNGAELRLLEKLKAMVGPLLAARVLDWFLANYEAAALFHSMVSLNEEQITRGLYAAYTRLETPPAQAEQSALKQLLRCRPNNHLAIWLAAWRRDWPQVKERLDRLSNDRYRTAAKDLLILKELNPAHLYVPGRGRLLTEAIAQAWPDSRIDLAPVVERLLRKGETDALLPLAPLLAGQSRRSLSEIHRRLQSKHVALLPAFAAALEEALKQQKSEQSWLRRMFFAPRPVKE